MDGSGEVGSPEGRLVTEDEVREALAANAERRAYWERSVAEREKVNGVPDYFGRRQVWRTERHRDELELMLAKVMHE